MYYSIITVCYKVLELSYKISQAQMFIKHQTIKHITQLIVCIYM